jgi:tetratricopeptide (TPR) repeat protein
LNKELKQQIKQDELVHAYQASASWLQGHKSQTRRAVEIGAVVLALVLGIGWFVSHRREQAERSLAEALEVFHGRVATETPASNEPTAGPTFATAQQKYEKAAEAFKKTADGHGSTDAGRRARYYLALCKVNLGQHAEAQKILEDLTGDGSRLERDQARLALAESRLASGAADKAIEDLQKLSDDRELAVPREYALMRLAAAQERAQQQEAAIKSYRRLTQEFPTSTYLPEARRKLESLGQSAS